MLLARPALKRRHEPTRVIGVFRLHIPRNVTPTQCIVGLVSVHFLMQNFNFLYEVVILLLEDFVLGQKRSVASFFSLEPDVQVLNDIL